MRTTASELALEARRVDGHRLVVELHGRLDARTGGLLVGCARSWADLGHRDITLDLANVVDLEEPGLAVLLRTRRVLRAHAGRLTVLDPPSDLAETLARTGLAS